MKLYDDILDDLGECLTTGEFSFAIRLAKHVSYKDCILRTNGNPNGKILNVQDLAVLMKTDPCEKICFFSCKERSIREACNWL